MIIKNVPKIWHRFTGKNSAGKKINFRFENLLPERFDDFLDFKMNYFVAHEVTHIVSGIMKNPAAIKEYRQIISKKFRKSSYNIAVCYPDGSDQIAASSAMTLFTTNDNFEEIAEANTKEVKNFFKILNKWNNLCPIPTVMKKYGVERYYEDAGAAVHPDFRRFGINGHMDDLRRAICKENNVPVTGAWCTSIGTQKAAISRKWDMIFEMSYDELGKILDVEFNDVPPTCMYFAKRMDDRAN